MLRASSWALFLTPILIWSTTFYAITFQLGGPTSPVWAVALRFACAVLLLGAWLLWREGSLLMPWAQHPLAACSGVLAYALSYVLTYRAEETIPSGWVAVCFTLMVFLTPLMSWVLLGSRAHSSVWWGGAMGVSGVTLAFLPSLLDAHGGPSFFWGLSMMLMAAMASSLASVCSLVLNQRAVPVTRYTFWAMVYGASTTACWALASGETLSFDTRGSFWLAFAYLASLGTVLAFLCYLRLMKREGPGLAMYISVLSPVGAVLVSVALEGMRPGWLGSLGIALAVLGAWITLRQHPSGSRS